MTSARLESVQLRNFVKFREEQVVNFMPGANILIGENDSGKTCFLEGIRRCLSLKANTSLSNAYNSKEFSCFVCKFSVQHLDRDVGYSCERIVSVVARLPSSPNQPDCFLKVVRCENDGDSEPNLALDVVMPHPTDFRIGNAEIKMDADALLTLQGCFGRNSQESLIDIESFLQFCEKYVRPKCDDKGDDKSTSIEYSNTKCERILSRITKSTIFTASLRSIGASQWTLSDKDIKNCVADAEKGAEIIKWYLQEMPSLPKSDIEQEQRIFNILTENSGFEFSLDKDNCIDVQKWGKRYMLLKVPEGILEAKLCAILLGVSRFSTVCLEDPERGMHPMMIYRLKDLVLLKLKEKVVLLTTHHPAFLSPWTLQRAFVFRRKRECSVILNGSNQQTRKTLQILGGDHICKLYFARRVFMVEGDADLLFLSKLLSMIVEDVHRFKPVFDQTFDLKKMAEFAGSLHLVNMGSEARKEILKQTCELLQLEHYFLLDRDSMEGDKVETFVESLHLPNQLRQLKVSEAIDDLENYDIFVWRYGTIEHSLGMIIRDDVSKKEDRIRFLRANNVRLLIDDLVEGKTIKLRNKLFFDKAVTDENISNVVDLFINASLDAETDVSRLIRFLGRCSQKQC